MVLPLLAACLACRCLENRSTDIAIAIEDQANVADSRARADTGRSLGEVIQAINRAV